jgi:predicted phage baseplate assembly protein
MSTDLVCRRDPRRAKVRAADSNGLDYLDVSDDQLTLTVTFIAKAPEGITAANVRVDGGRRVKGIRVTWVRLCIEDDPELDDCMLVTVDKPGDHSTYTLRLVEPDELGRPGERPLAGIDPRYARLAFSFKVGCQSELDCAAADPCPPVLPPEPELSYLAKDYESFRRLLLDRLALIMPAWRDREVPDVGIALVELLAYVGDHLSYQQDAAATEAYLDTARRRISVRRHLRLIDYDLHDGCNARAWVCLESDANLTLGPGSTWFATDPGATIRPGEAALRADDLDTAPDAGYEVFEPVVAAPVEVRAAHSAISLWTWGGEECCLPRGATRATLRDGAPRGPAYAGKPPERVLRLHPGDVLVLEEVLGPGTGQAADADPTHRQAVRLTRVEPGVDDVYGQPVLEVEWAAEDALAFPLCLSIVAGDDCQVVEGVSVARGNVVLVDQGRSITSCGRLPEPLEVPAATTGPGPCEAPGMPGEPVSFPPVFAPTLRHGPLTQRAPFPSPPVVARHQAERVAGIRAAVLDRVRELESQAGHGDPLTGNDLAELAIVFGPQALADAGLPDPAARPRRQYGPQEQAEAIGRLLAGADRLLTRKTSRLETLGLRAAAGYVLGPDEEDELVAAWGDRYAKGLTADNPAFFGPARDAAVQDPRAVLPAVELRPAGSQGPELAWRPRRHLLASGRGDRHFVVEIDDDGRAHLRFGDGKLGRAVVPGSTLLAAYRVGNGSAGNLGRDTITRVVSCGARLEGITRVWNPLPATGGTDPEPVATARLFAPGTMRRIQRRAVTATDYAYLAGQVPGVQRAAASLRWTGSRYEVQVAVDQLGRDDAEEWLLAQVRSALELVRRIGHDVVVGPVHAVPLDIALAVCVLPDHVRGQVRGALLDLLSNRVLPDGRKGLFHPDNLTFGNDIRLGTLVAAAQAVAGVEAVQVTRLRRLGESDRGELRDGVLRLGPLELGRLDNDPGNPENGQLVLELEGGR